MLTEPLKAVSFNLTSATKIEINFNTMVLAKPDNKHVFKAFDLSGKVAAVTGTCQWLCAFWQDCDADQKRRCTRNWFRGLAGAC